MRPKKVHTRVFQQAQRLLLYTHYYPYESCLVSIMRQIELTKDQVLVRENTCI